MSCKINTDNSKLGLQHFCCLVVQPVHEKRLLSTRHDATPKNVTRTRVKHFNVHVRIFWCIYIFDLIAIFCCQYLTELWFVGKNQIAKFCKKLFMFYMKILILARKFKSDSFIRSPFNFHASCRMVKISSLPDFEHGSLSPEGWKIPH